LRVPFEKQFRLLKKIVPDLQPIALIYIKNQKVNIAGAEEAGRKTGVSLALIEIESVRELEDALEKATLRAKALLLILNNDLYNSATSKELLLFSARNKFPIIAFTPNYVRAGALLSFSSDFSENGRSAAKLGALILKNEPVVEKFIPTEKAWVAWNESVAKAFGINLAKSGEDEIHEYL